jgi:hypothetical protein
MSAMHPEYQRGIRAAKKVASLKLEKQIEKLGKDLILMSAQMTKVLQILDKQK